MKPTRKTDDEIQAIVSQAIEDAQDFIESEIMEKRDKAQRYFNGDVYLEAEEGRSKVIATKCRDAVRAVKPSLLRVFLSSDKPVEFIPRGMDDVGGAEQANEYITWKFNQKSGYILLRDAFHDALVKKTGILKAYYEDATKEEIEDYTNLTDDQYAFVINRDDVEVIEHSEDTETLPDGQVITLHNVKISITKDDGDINIVTVPPEDFFIDRQATNIEDAYVVGHRTTMRVGDLVEMGFDFDTVVTLTDDEDTEGDESDYARRGFIADDTDESALDPSMKPVTVYEAYMRMDIEGTGVPRMYSFIMGGGQKELLTYELCDDVPFAIFEVDPEPHAFFGRSLVDILMEDQDAATVLLRGLLDNVMMTNNPGFAFDPALVNTDDLMNNEIGRLVRVKGNVGAALMPLATPFTAGATLPALQYYDMTVESKTGISSAAIGLNPDALQSSTAAGVNATIGAAEGQMEVIARNLAEGGMKRLFKLLLNLVRKHVGPGEMMRLNGKYVPVDPSSWGASMDITVNVGLGTGRKEERAMVLRETLAQQMQVWQGYGPGNGIVSLTQIRNTLADILKSGGIHNVDRHWNPMDPQTEQMMLQQAAQAAQGQQAPDPNAAIAQAEIAKAQIQAQAKLQSDQIESQRKAQTDMAKLSMEAQRYNQDDDRERDKMDMDMVIEAARILGQYGVEVNKAQIQQLQNAPR